MTKTRSWPQLDKAVLAPLAATTGRFSLPVDTTHSAPRHQSYLEIQADPRLLERTPQLAAEFEAAPWLLPRRTRALPYTGVHGFDELLALRSLPAGAYSKSVTLLLFNKDWAVMTQNSSERGSAGWGNE